MRTDQARREIRYETIIATLVGVSALFVSGYTAYVQRQQVRATVWPILEYGTSNDPKIGFTVDNKGVGPAIIRNVIVRVNGEPVRNWQDALQKLLGPGEYRFTQSSTSGHTFSDGESLDVMVPHNFDGTPLASDKSNPLWSALNKDRGRLEVEICYSCTLGDCWTLRSGPNGGSTTETRTCPIRQRTASSSSGISNAQNFGLLTSIPILLTTESRRPGFRLGWIGVTDADTGVLADTKVLRIALGRRHGGRPSNISTP